MIELRMLLDMNGSVGALVAWCCCDSLCAHEIIILKKYTWCEHWKRISWNDNGDVHVVPGILASSTGSLIWQKELY